MKGKNLLILVLLFLVVVMGGYLIYDKVLDKDNVNNNDSVVNEEGEEQFINKAFDVTKFEEFKNHNGTYGHIESLLYDYSDGYYIVNLGLDGDVLYSYYEYTSNNEVKKVQAATILEDAVDILEYSADVEEDYVYMLDIHGDVYRMKITDIIGENWPVKKMNVSNIVKIMYIGWAPEENSGGCCGTVVAVTKNGEYVKLVS